MKHCTAAEQTAFLNTYFQISILPRKFHPKKSKFLAIHSVKWNSQQLNHPVCHILTTVVHIKTAYLKYALIIFAFIKWIFCETSSRRGSDTYFTLSDLETVLFLLFNKVLSAITNYVKSPTELVNSPHLPQTRHILYLHHQLQKHLSCFMFFSQFPVTDSWLKAVMQAIVFAEVDRSFQVLHKILRFNNLSLHF